MDAKSQENGPREATWRRKTLERLETEVERDGAGFYDIGRLAPEGHRAVADELGDHREKELP